MSQVNKPENEEKKTAPKQKSAAAIARKKSTEQKRKDFKAWKKDLVVTMETEIPELPKKAEKLSQPNHKDLQEELEKIEKTIQKTISEYNDFRSEVLNQHKEKISGIGTINVRDVLKEVSNKKKDVLKDFLSLRDQVNEKKDLIEELFEKSQKYRMQMKKLGSKKELEEKLAELEDIQASESISLNEEKEIMKEISDIKKSIPFAAPLEELNVQMNELKKERKVVFDKMTKVRETLNKYNKEIDECKSVLDTNKDMKKGENEKLNPFLEEKKKEKDDKIIELKEQRKNANKKYYDSLKAYEEQQQHIEKINFMTKVKARIQREAERAAREAEEQALIEEEQKLANIDPYKEEADLCQLLIDYCKKLMPQEAKGDQPKEQTAEEKKDIEAILATGDYKKEKVTLFTKTQEDLFNVGGAKGGKGKKGKGKGKKEEANANKPESLNHKFDVLGFFESLKVAPPMFTSKLEGTIKILQEKKEYFEAQTEKAAEDKVEPKEEDAQKKAPEKKKQKALNFQEEEFPSI